MALTPGDVREARFKDAQGGRPGYDKHEVDVFLHRVAATLAGRDSLTAEDVLGFTPPKRADGGYAVYAVDAFFAEVALTLMERSTAVPAAERGPAVPVAHPAPPAHAHYPAPPAHANYPAPPTAPVPPRQPPHGNAVPRPRPPVSTRPQQANGHVLAAPPPAPASHPRPPRHEAPAAPQEPAPAQVYDEDEVHAFLARIEATVAGRDRVTAQDVLAARFNPPPPGKRGYRETEFLYLVAESLKNVEGGPAKALRAVQAAAPAAPPAPAATAAPPVPTAPPVPAAPAAPSVPAAPRLSAEEIHNVRFHQTPPDELGYSEDEVDAFLDRVEATLEGEDVLTVEDVRQVRFGEVPGGYDQDEVDTLLDLIEYSLDG